MNDLPLTDPETEEADAKAVPEIIGYRFIGEFPHRGAGKNSAATGLRQGAEVAGEEAARARHKRASAL